MVKQIGLTKIYNRIQDLNETIDKNNKILNDVIERFKKLNNNKAKNK